MSPVATNTTSPQASSSAKKGDTKSYSSTDIFSLEHHVRPNPSLPLTSPRAFHLTGTHSYLL
jgi:hypothetical protein